MKNLILISVFLLFSISMDVDWFDYWRADYFVSETGSDSNSGTAPWSAWQTLTKVNATTFSPGDRIAFNGNFSGTITVGQSGIAGSPITYKSYGDGATITGFTPVTAWTNTGGNIWESTNAVSTLTTMNMVVIGGVNTPMGREPDTGYWYFQSHVDGTTSQITSTYLDGVINWTGAEVAVNVYAWETRRGTIISQTGSTIEFNEPQSFSIYENDAKFIIQNDIRTLDQQNEWYYNPTTKKISVYSTTEPTDVKVSSVNYLASVSGKNYITFKNIAFTGSNDRAVSLSVASNITIDNCDITYSGAVGIYGSLGDFSTYSSNLSVHNCTFDESNDGAIGVSTLFTNATISHNTVTNTGMIYGAGRIVTSGTNSAGSFTAISAVGSGSSFEYNSIENTGYNGIAWLGDSVTVINNYITNFCQINHDGGGIYTWNSTNPVHPVYSGNVIAYNIIINDATVFDLGHTSSRDNGIYLDDSSNGIEISYNTIEMPVGAGLFVHNSQNTSVHHNTIYNSLRGVDFYAPTQNLTGVSLSNNIIISKSGQRNYWVDPAEEVTLDITSDYNIFGKPIDNNIGMFKSYIRTPSWLELTQSLSEWQTYSGQDANSVNSQLSVTTDNDIQLIYNNTNQTKTYDLGGSTFKDIEGNTISDSLKLQPFTSTILIGKNFECINQKPDISD